MKSYLKLLPVMLYPYLYLPLFFVLFQMSSKLDTIDFIYENIILYLIIFHGILLCCAIVHSVQTGKGAYDVAAAVKMNLITKCIQIPAYVLHFILGCCGFLMGIMGLGFLLYAVVVDVISITFTGISAIGCGILLKKNGIIQKRTAVLGMIGSFFFCVDVAVAFFYYRRGG